MKALQPTEHRRYNSKGQRLTYGVSDFIDHKPWLTFSHNMLNRVRKQNNKIKYQGRFLAECHFVLVLLKRWQQLVYKKRILRKILRKRALTVGINAFKFLSSINKRIGSLCSILRIYWMKFIFFDIFQKSVFDYKNGKSNSFHKKTLFKRYFRFFWIYKNRVQIIDKKAIRTYQMNSLRYYLKNWKLVIFLIKKLILINDKIIKIYRSQIFYTWKNITKIKLIQELWTGTSFDRCMKLIVYKKCLVNWKDYNWELYLMKNMLNKFTILLYRKAFSIMAKELRFAQKYLKDKSYRSINQLDKKDENFDINTSNLTVKNIKITAKRRADQCRCVYDVISGRRIQCSSSLHLFRRVLSAHSMGEKSISATQKTKAKAKKQNYNQHSHFSMTHW